MVYSTSWMLSLLTPSPWMTLTFGFKVDAGPFELERIVVDPPGDPWWWNLWAVVWFMASMLEHAWHWGCDVFEISHGQTMPWKVPAFMDPRIFKNLSLNGIEQYTPGGLWVGSLGEPSLSIFHPTAPEVKFKFDTLWPGSEGTITVRNPTSLPMNLRISLAGSIDHSKKRRAA